MALLGSPWVAPVRGRWVELEPHKVQERGECREIHVPRPVVPVGPRWSQAVTTCEGLPRARGQIATRTEQRACRRGDQGSGSALVLVDDAAEHVTADDAARRPRRRARDRLCEPEV